MNKKFKRRNFFINKELQGKYMLSFAVPMVILLVFLSVLFYISLVKGLEGSVKLLNRDVEDVVSFSLQGESDPTAEEYKNALDAVQRTIANFVADKGKKEAVLKLLLWIIIPGFLLLSLQVLLLTIFFSHKLAGPIYRIEIALQRTIDGNYEEFIKLREGDQLIHLADLVNTAIKVSGERIRDAYDNPKEENKEKLNLPIDS